VAMSKSEHAHGGHGEDGASPSKKRRLLCSLGTGEVVHVMHFRAAPGKRREFEVIVQQIAHGLYHFEAGISDVRVGHPSCDEVCALPTYLKLRAHAATTRKTLIAMHPPRMRRSASFSRS